MVCIRVYKECKHLTSFIFGSYDYNLPSCLVCCDIVFKFIQAKYNQVSLKGFNFFISPSCDGRDYEINKKYFQ